MVIISQLYNAAASEKKRIEEGIEVIEEEKKRIEEGIKVTEGRVSELLAEDARLREENAKLGVQYSRLKGEYDLLLSANSNKRHRIFSKTPLISNIESSLQEKPYPSLTSWEIRGSRVYLPYFNAEHGEFGVTTNTDLDMLIGVDKDSMEGFWSIGKDFNKGKVSEFLKKCPALSPYFNEKDFNFECNSFVRDKSLVNLSVKLSANSEGHLTENPNLDITIYGPDYRKSKPICDIAAVCLEYKGGGKSFELRRGVFETKKSDRSDRLLPNEGQKPKVLARLFSMLTRAGCDFVAEVGVNEHIMNHLKADGCLDQIVEVIGEVHPGSGLGELVRSNVNTLLSSNSEQCKVPGSYADRLKLGTHHVGTPADGPGQSSGGGAAMGSHSMVPAASPGESFVVDPEKSLAFWGLR